MNMEPFIEPNGLMSMFLSEDFMTEEEEDDLDEKTLEPFFDYHDPEDEAFRLEEFN